MPMEQEDYLELIQKLNVSIDEINKRNYKEFLELLQFNDEFLLAYQRHFHPKFAGISTPGPYNYGLVKTFDAYLSEILDTASFVQQCTLFPLLLNTFAALDEKVSAFHQSQPKDDFSIHLGVMNGKIQELLLLKQEAVNKLQEKIDNQGVNQDLIDIIKRLKANISGQKNDRKTDYYSQWKVDLFTVIENRLAQTDSLSTSEYLQYVADIREVCAKKRNTWHFWSEPHSVAEFEVMLEASSLTDITSDTISESSTGAAAP